MLLPFLPTNVFVRAQESPRIDAFLSGISPSTTISVNQGDLVHVQMFNLQRGIPFTLRVATKDGRKTYDSLSFTPNNNPNATGSDRECIPINPLPEPFREGIKIEGEDASGKPKEVVDACLRNDINNTLSYFVGINTKDFNCKADGGDGTCSIRLSTRSADGKYTDVASPINLTVKAVSGSNGQKIANDPLADVRLSLDKSTAYLGQPVTVTVTGIPKSGVVSTPFELTIGQQNGSGKPYAQIIFSIEVKASTAGCVPAPQDPRKDIWTGILCKEENGAFKFTATINTLGLDYSDNSGDAPSSFPYLFRLTANGKELSPPQKKVLLVKNELGLRLDANPPRGKQTNPNEVTMDEGVPLTATALGCTTGNVQFQFWGEPAGMSCALGGTCGYEQSSYSGNAPASEDTATATYNLSKLLLDTQDLDKNDDGFAEIGVRATCEATNKKATGKITLYREGIIQIDVIEKIIDWYDKGIRGFEKIPIVDPNSPIKYSVYGLRPGQNSPGAGLLDRSNCFYVELYRGGVRLKRPLAYPTSLLGKTSCLAKDGDPRRTILIDDPDYAFHIFNGEQDDTYEDLTLCEGNACKKTASANSILADGEYELKIFEANGFPGDGLSNNADCITNPNLNGCENLTDSFVTSTKFQVGNAFHKGSPPPCAKALIQFTAAQRGKVTTSEQSFESAEAYEAYFKNNPDHILLRCLEVNTALGGFATDPAGFVSRLLGFLLGISGGIALLLIIRAGYQVMTSRGDPEKLGEARERLTSAIVGLLFIIFSLVILEVIGVDILRLPGFCRSGDTNCLNQGSANDPSVTKAPEEP